MNGVVLLAVLVVVIYAAYKIQERWPDFLFWTAAFLMWCLAAISWAMPD